MIVRKFFLLVASAIALSIMLGCASGSVNTLKRYPKRPSGYPIYLIDSDIEEPYETVATIRSPAFDDYEARERGEEWLKRWARRLGGDAVIHVKRNPTIQERAGFEPFATFRVGTRLVTAYYYTGTVVRLQRAKRHLEAPGPSLN